jgi:NADH:ubiquinone oxidoreductase subunit 4 (subunit M)
MNAKPTKIVIMGVYPTPFQKTMEPSVKALVERMAKHQQRAVAVEEHAAPAKRGGV